MTSVSSPFFAIQRLGSRVRARPCPGRSDERISSGSFLQVMPAGRFADHRPVYLPHFLRSSACSQRVRARPFGGAAHRCDGGQSAGHPCCGGRFAFRRGPLCTAHAMRFFTTFFFTPFAFLMFSPPASRIEYILGRRPTYSAMERPAHSSFIFPSTFLLAVLYSG